MKASVNNRGREFEFDQQTRQHIQQAARWLIDPNGTPGLMLMGLCGNGKSTLAQAISWLVAHVTDAKHEIPIHKAKAVTRLCAASQHSKTASEQYDKIFTLPMMILDDLGEEPTEALVYGMVHTPIVDLICERYDKQRLTIVTTNLNTDELRNKYGARIYDRFQEMFTTIAFENDSYRTERVQKHFRKQQELEAQEALEADEAITALRERYRQRVPEAFTPAAPVDLLQYQLLGYDQLPDEAFAQELQAITSGKKQIPSASEILSRQLGA